MEEICSTCLSGERTLQKLGSLEPLFRVILPEITEETGDLAICWECTSILRKCHKFRSNVLKARVILERLNTDLVKSKDGVEALKSLSSLRKYTQTKYDFNIAEEDPKCIITVPENKLLLEVDTASATDVKIETPDELDLGTSNDPLVPSSSGVPKHVEEIYIEPATDFVFDDDSEEEVLSKVKVKMKNIKPKDDSAKAAVDATDIPNSKMQKKTVKIKKRSKKVSFKEGKRSRSKKEKNVAALDEIPADEPSDEQVLEMFTSIMFCKNQFDVDGNNAEVLVLSPSEVLARRVVLSEDASYSEAKYKCEGCLRGYETRRALEEHRAVNHVPREGERQCRVCACWVPRGVFALHAGRHRALFRCRVCGYCDHEPLALLRHLRHHTRHRGQNYCWMCKINFRNPRGLRLHKEKVHSGNKETFTCDKCGKTFNCSIYYRDHLKRHAYQPIPCKICNKICKSASAHSFHMKAHATVMSGEKFKCVECDIDFAQPVLLKNHFQTRKHMHPSEFKHICEICGKGFLWASNLQEHVNYVHRKQTDYVCQLCSKMFVSARCMRNHIKLVHEGHKPKKNKECNICGKRFAGKKTLTDHINTHTGVRPYKCEECGDTFKQAAALFTHRRLVHQGYRKTRRAPTESVAAFTGNI